MGTETPQRPRKEAAGSRQEPGLVRHTAPASTDPIGPQTQTLLEEVLRRENLRTALKGLEAARARKATATGRGAWWNAGASHMHAAVNNRLLAVWGLLNLLTQLRDLQRRT